MREAAPASAAAAARQDPLSRELTVSFDGFKALNALTLYVDPGELRCIIGPNGAGKTTMMDVITGKTRPDEGTAWFGQQRRSADADRAGDRAGRHRPQVPEADRVRAPDRVREPRAGAGRPTSRSGRCCVARLTPAQRDRIDEVLDDHRPRRSSATRSPARSSHGQKQWLEIGMLLMQEPELLLVDEPVAGMTPQETERTAELLLSLAGKHSVVVVEHDMEFVRSIARQVTVLHEGQRARRRRHGPGAERSARHRGLSRSMSLLTIKALNQSYGGSHTLWDVDLDVPAGLAHLPDGPQRHGQDHAAQVHHGPAAGDSGDDHVRRHRPAAAAGGSAGPARHRLRAAGPRDLPAAHRRGEPARRPRRAQGRRARRFRRGSSSCSRC